MMTHICALLCLCSCLHSALQQCSWWLNSKLFIIWGQLHAASLEWKDQLHKSIHQQSQIEISTMLLHQIIQDCLHKLFIWFIIIFALDMHEYALNSNLSCTLPHLHQLSQKITCIQSLLLSYTTVHTASIGVKKKNIWKWV